MKLSPLLQLSASTLIVSASHALDGEPLSSALRGFLSVSELTAIHKNIEVPTS